MRSADDLGQQHEIGRCELDASNIGVQRQSAKIIDGEAVAAHIGNDRNRAEEAAVSCVSEGE